MATTIKKTLEENKGAECFVVARLRRNALKGDRDAAREIQEGLEQQAGTSKILRAIANAPGLRFRPDG